MVYEDRDWRDCVVVGEAKEKISEDVKAQRDYNGDEVKKKVQVVFSRIDGEKGNGWLEMNEFRKFIKKLGITLNDSEFDHLMDEIDEDHSGKIDFEEFFTFYVKLLNKSDKTKKEKDLQQNLCQNRDLNEFNMQVEEKKKIKAIYDEIDTSGNGKIEVDEFQIFINKIGAILSKKEFNHLVKEIDTDQSGIIDFNEFLTYYYKLLHKSKRSEQEEKILCHLAKNDNLKKLNEQVSGKIRNEKLVRVYAELQYKNKTTPDSNIQELIDRNQHINESKSCQDLEDRLVEAFDDADVADLADLIAERWESYGKFRRKGHDGDLVMKGSLDMADALPGDYDLVELVMTQFGEVANKKVPRHVVVKGTDWMSAKSGDKDGRLVCPPDWDGIIPVDIGTTNLLGYYGACIATDKEEKVALLQRHGTTDFTYLDGYHSNYVIDSLGGNGIEKHGFHHMDCPMEDNSGFFILGKYFGEDLHLTAFRIPKYHVLYVPPFTIHSNDHMKGTWRTMLSDASDTPIDHVLIQRPTRDKSSFESIDIKFETSWAHFGKLDGNVICTSCETGEEHDPVS